MPDQQQSIVIVEDDAGMRKAIERLLRAGGFQWVSFASAEAFMQAGAADTAGCLVLDINLPGLSGFQLQRQLMASGRKSPVIFITAHDDEVARAEAGRIGSVAYFRKPFDGKVFLREIVRALKGN
ncbi:MAG: response regulator [Deltaproteobacteria bacterium]|nr:MAG: response regulator [Deltaproteobacteria bacterium]